MLPVFCLSFAINFFDESKVHAEYAFSANGYEYHFISGDYTDYSFMYGGNWDKVYPVIVGVFKNNLPHSSLVYIFVQKNGVWYYTIKDVSKDFAPVSSNSGAYAVFKIMQKDNNNYESELDKKRRADYLYDFAQNCFEQKKYYDALIAFQNYKKFDSEQKYFEVDYNIAICYWYIATIYLKKENYIDAVENYEKSLNIYEDYKKNFCQRHKYDSRSFEKTPRSQNFREGIYNGLVAAYIKLGKNYFDNQQYEKSLEVSEKANKYYKKFDEYYKETGLRLDEHKFYSILNEYNSEVLIYDNLGNAQLKLKNYDEAITNFKKALSQKSDYESAFNNLWTAYWESKKFNEAVEFYSQRVKNNKNDSKSWFRLGWSLNELKNYPESIKAIQKSIKLKPTANSYYWLACVYENSNSTKKAVPALKKALELNPNYEDAKNLLAKLSAKK